jgi:hypothetical protein
MTLHVYDLEQRTNEWYAARCGLITASAVGQLITTRTLGAGDYECPTCEAGEGDPCISLVKRAGVIGAPIKTVHPARAGVAAENSGESPVIIEVADNDTSRAVTALLAAERVAHRVDPTFVNADMWRGVESEDPAREKYAEHYGVEVATCGFMVLDEPGFRLGYSPDGLVGGDGLLEIKGPRQKGHFLTAVNGVVPDFHVAQIQAGLMVSGRKWCDFVSFNGGMHLWVKRVTPDPDWQRAITAAATAFEVTAEQLVSDYLAAVEGFPMTERLELDLEVVI